MARDEKVPQLRTVDDEPEVPSPVIRLGDRETLREVPDQRPLRLGPVPELIEEAPAEDESRRLAVPSKEEVELRTHQPGIEVLIENDAANPELLEKGWGEASETRSPIPWGWFALIGLAIAGAVIWSATHVRQADVTADQIRVETESALLDEQQEEREAARLVERIESCIKRYFATTSVESRVRLVRHPERVGPMMKAYYGKQPVAAERVKSIRMLQPLTLDQRGDFWMASVAMEGGTTRSLIIQASDEIEPKIDWETLVCYQPMAWDEFVTRAPTSTSLDFRVYVEPDTFHSHEFADTDKWTSFRLTALDSEEPLFGYAQADSAAEQALLQVLQTSVGRRASVILRLVVPEGLRARRSAVIEKVVNHRWLFIDPPAESP